MTYPKNFEQKIGFDTLCELLSQECISELGLEFVQKIGFISDFKTLHLYLEQTDEFRRVLMLEKPFPSTDYIDLRPELKRLRIKGTFITIEGLQLLHASYTTIREIKSYFISLSATTYPRLSTWSEKLEIVPEISIQIQTILDSTGEIKDNASDKLASIRSQIRKKQGETQKYIRRYLNEAKKEGYVSEEAEVTLRNDRLVIPVTAAHKRSMKGFIHDISSSGQTVFMEPEEIFNLNNEIVELFNAERLEIIEILKTFTLFLLPFLPILLDSYHLLGFIDFLRAKARLAIKLQAGMPIISEKPCLNWRDARHPLLYLTLQKQGKSIVPLDIGLDDKEHILIISGPNAGGKSVCLKTVGLLQYMLQCGLLVPMRETSEVGLFHHIFVDIGDEQSIENDLSTYSSHLKNMKFWLENGDSSSLFLADELGSGTEPQLGGAIAESILEMMENKGAYGIVTTHYTNLKLMAKQYKGIVNGAMLFNKEKLQPLYLFKKGLPGSSFAFEMARNIGLPESLIQLAGQKTGQQHLHFEEELQQIEVEKQALKNKIAQVNIADELLSSTVEKYQNLYKELLENKQHLMRKAKDDAQILIKNANARIEKTIREIREVQAEKATTTLLRKELHQCLNPVSLPTPTLETPKEKIETLNFSTLQAPISKVENLHPQKQSTSSSPELSIGCLVRLQGGSSIALVSEIKGKQIRINFDYMSMQVPLDKVIVLSQGETQQYKQQHQKVAVFMKNINEKKIDFSPNVDIRGLRGTEAEERVQKLLDDASLYGEKYLQILHGKGDGILRNITREILGKNSHIASYSDQKEELGGSGITLVELL